MNEMPLLAASATLRNVIGRLIRLCFASAVLLMTPIAAAPVRAAPLAHVDASEVAGLLVPSPPEIDIRFATRSPDGKHILFFLQEYRSYVYGDYVAPWWCRDNWVMRADGTQLTRLTTSCDLGDVYSKGRSPAWWLDDGSVVSGYSSPNEKSGTSTMRWKLTATEPADAWHASEFRGTPTRVTPDQRYVVVTQTEWAYFNTYWWALDLQTGKSHFMWDELHQGDGRWTEACASAHRPADEPWTPKVEDVVAALMGEEPACTFARRAPEPTLTPTPAAPLAAEQLADVNQLSNAAPWSLTPTASAPLSAASTQPPAPPISLLTVTGLTARRTLAIQRGFRVTLTTSKIGSLKVWLMAPVSDGGVFVIARTSVKRAIGRVAVNLALGEVAKRQLRRVSRVTVRIAFTTPDGHRLAVDRVVNLKR